MSVTSVYKVIQEERSVFLEVIASVIVKKNVHKYVSNSEKLPKYSCLSLEIQIALSVYGSG
jgi:hypothetical protein